MRIHDRDFKHVIGILDGIERLQLHERRHLQRDERAGDLGDVRIIGEGDAAGRGPGVEGGLEIEGATAFEKPK